MVLPTNPRAPTEPPHTQGRTLSILAVLLYGVLGLAVVAAGISAWRGYRMVTRGIESGDAAQSIPAREPRIGTNVALEQYADDVALRSALRRVRSLGVNTVRQVFDWSAMEPSPGAYRWDLWDHVLPIARAEGVRIVAVLNGTPRWARPTWDVANPSAPPDDLQTYADFAGAFADRFGGMIEAYQVWDQPNIYPNWGSGEIDPAAYVDMLRITSAAIRATDGDAVIVSGALAPNTEPGGRNMSDVRFLREMYRLGAEPWFDVVGAKPYGFWSGPQDRRVDEDVLNMSRVILLREEMVRLGDAATPIWGLEAGWASLPDDWAGAPVPQGSDTELVQSERLRGAIDRVRQEWPWMGYLCVQHLQPSAPADDPLWGFALLTRQGEPNQLYRAIQESLRGEATAWPGTTAEPAAVLKRANNFPLAELRFWGTGLAFDVVPDGASGMLTVSVFGQPGEVAIDLGAGSARVPVADGLPLGLHTALLQGTAAQMDTIAAIHVSRAAVPWGLVLQLGTATLVAVWSLVGAVRSLLALPVIDTWQRLRGRAERQHAILRWALLVGALAAVAWLPAPRPRLGALALYGLLALCYPSESLAVAVATIPLAPLTVGLGMGTFSVAEITVLVAAVAWAWNTLLRPRALWRASLTRARRAFHWGDAAVLALVILALAEALTAVYRREALREVRLCVFEPALLYAIVRAQSRPARMRLLDAVYASGAGVALYALARYPSAEGVIVADGVRRARAFYGSPNNLALVLERLLPVGLAVLFWGHTRWRRWLYGAGLAVLGAALVLTYSRGALLLGVPAGLLALAARRGRKASAVLVSALAVGLILAVALLGAGRLADLANPAQGTAFLRISLWRSALEMIRDHPWFGVGPDNFLYYYGDYVQPGAEVDRWLSHPHNVILDFWVRLGVGGLTLFVLLLVRCARDGRHRVSLSAGDEHAMAVGLIGAAAAAVAHGLVDAFFFVPELALGCLFGLAWLGDDDSSLSHDR